MKKKLVVLAAATLTVAAAVPALAFENEFHGLYRLKGIVTNFQSAGLSGTTAKDAAPTSSQLLSTENRSYTLFEQRARLQYIAKASDDLKLVTHFEIDSTWGDSAYQNGRGQGGGIAADTVNLETKNVYLDFKLPSAPVSFKVGIQGFTDAYKGIFLNDDVGGVVATGRFGAATASAAFFRTYDQGGTTALGKKNVDVYVLDGKFSPSKEVTLGASCYLANNDINYSGQQTHTLGVNAAAKVGITSVDAFILYQTGDELYAVSGKDLSAFAGQVAAKINLGTVTLRAAGLYASGDDGKGGNKSNAYQNIFAAGKNPAVAGSTNGAPGGTFNPPSTSSGQYYSASMLILLRNSLNCDSDNSLVSSINNENRGLVAAFIGADAKISDKLSASVNIGSASVAKRDETAVAKSRTTATGVATEFNASVNYALYTNLTATVQGAYALLGGYTKAGNGKDLQNPYATGLMLNYTF